MKTYKINPSFMMFWTVVLGLIYIVVSALLQFPSFESVSMLFGVVVVVSVCIGWHLKNAKRIAEVRDSRMHKSIKAQTVHALVTESDGAMRLRELIAILEDPDTDVKYTFCTHKSIVWSLLQDIAYVDEMSPEAENIGLTKFLDTNDEPDMLIVLYKRPAWTDRLSNWSHPVRRKLTVDDIEFDPSTIV